MRSRPAGIVALAAVAAAAVALVAVELGLGAGDYGGFRLADPCSAEASFPGEGLDATIQRIGLSGLNGAACELGTTREELVLSFVPEIGSEEPIRWDAQTIERAARAGLLRAVDDAKRRGSLGSIEAFVLREAVRRAPIDWLVEGASGLGSLIG